MDQPSACALCSCSIFDFCQSDGVFIILQLFKLYIAECVSEGGEPSLIESSGEIRVDCSSAGDG